MEDRLQGSSRAESAVLKEERVMRMIPRETLAKIIVCLMLLVGMVKQCAVSFQE